MQSLRYILEIGFIGYANRLDVGAREKKVITKQLPGVLYKQLVLARL